jgi:hypothetical protein
MYFKPGGLISSPLDVFPCNPTGSIIITISAKYKLSRTAGGREPGWELEEGLWRRLYSKEVGGRSPGPCRRVRAVMSFDDAPGRQGAAYR